MVIRIPINPKNKLPGLNDIIHAAGSSPYQYAKMKRQTMEQVGWPIRCQARGAKFTQPVTIRLRFFEPYDRKNRRDDDNILSGGCKFILDELTNQGIIKDDNPKWVHVLPERIKDCEPDDMRVEIEITEQEAAGNG